MTTFRRLLVFAALAFAASPAVAGDKPAKAGRPGPEGLWEGGCGRLELKRNGDQVTGSLVAAGEGCRLGVPSEVLKGAFLEDTLSAEVRVGALVPACGEDKGKAYVVLLLTKKGKLTGGVTAKAKCARDAGVATFVRAATDDPAKPMVGERPVDGTYDPRGQRVDALPSSVSGLMEQAKAAMEEGGPGIEKSRKLFQKAIEKEPGLGEAYNGVGITFYLRNDWDAAIEWYKKGLEAAPGFGDLYYNLACSFSLKGKKALALRYLRLAANKGYAEVAALDEDHDLDALREEPDFKEIRAQMEAPPPPMPE